MYNVSGEVKKFIKNTKENWSRFYSRRKKLNRVKIPRGIFQRDALSTLLFVIAMIPLNHILRKCSGGYKLHKLLEKNQPLAVTQTAFENPQLMLE